MDGLNERFAWIEDSVFAKRILSCVIWLNPFAIAPQVWKAAMAPSVEGISVLMYIIFALLQAAFLFQGIRLKDKGMFTSMVASIAESLAIIVIVLLR